MNDNRMVMASIIAASLLLLAAPDAAFAEKEAQVRETTDSALQDTHVQRAKEANQAAVDEAAKALLADTKLDLDIHIARHKSVIVAARQ